MDVETEKAIHELRYVLAGLARGINVPDWCVNRVALCLCSKCRKEAEELAARKATEEREESDLDG